MVKPHNVACQTRRYNGPWRDRPRSIQGTSTRARMSLDGILVIDKEVGWTSHDVVARVRRITGERKVGHTGTLDPAATGVLPVCLGAATKIIEYLQDAGKTYYA